MRARNRGEGGRSARVKGALGTVLATSPLARGCPTCDAKRGSRCVVWMVDKGVRVRILRTMAGFHAERRTKRKS